MSGALEYATRRRDRIWNKFVRSTSPKWMRLWEELLDAEQLTCERLAALEESRAYRATRKLH